MRSILRRILTEAVKIRVQSIAIPPLGAGNLRYPVNLVARTIVMETLSFIRTQQETSLKEIKLVVPPDESSLIKVD
jgi:O-acetyl-ADP-ribose deacetylase (regulator of RNase III)